MDMKIDESDLDIPVISPVCVRCARLDVTQRRRCAAFGTADIPFVIWEGENPHVTPYRGDHGLQFIPWSEGLSPDNLAREGR